MPASVLRIVVAATMLAASCPLPASAQFGLPGMPRVGRLPLPVPGPGRAFRVLPGMHFGKFRRTFGIIGAVAVGSVILHRLNRREGVEVTRRTRVVLDKDPNQEVTDVYRTPDGSKQVTITAGPTQKVSNFRDDPALQATAESIQQGNSSESGKSKGKSDTLSASEVVKVDQLPGDADCRRVTMQMEVKSAAKGRKKAEQQSDDGKTTNVSVLCNTGGEWKPASI
jgi:hypothetical protein